MTTIRGAKDNLKRIQEAAYISSIREAYGTDITDELDISGGKLIVDAGNETYRFEDCSPELLEKIKLKKNEIKRF